VVRGVVALTIGDASAGVEPSLPLTTTTSAAIVEEESVVVEELEPVKPNNDNDKEDGDERSSNIST